jgi:hypothetical protein
MSELKSHRSTSSRSKNLMSRAVGTAALAFPLIASAPASAGALTAAEFAVTTCRSVMGEVAKADALAKEQEWTAIPQRPVNANGLKSISTWAAARGDDKFTITVGTVSIAGASGDSNSCTVMFPGMKLPRDAFFGALSAVLDLKPQANMTFPQAHLEVFKIKTSGPAKQLLLASSGNGDVVMIQMIAVQIPDADQTPGAARIDGSVRVFRGLDADTVYVLAKDGKLWRESGERNNILQPPVEVDTNVAAFQPLGGRTVYILGADGNLWRETVDAAKLERPRDPVDENVRAFQALDGDTTYVLATDGNLWRETVGDDNTPPSRQAVDGHVRAFQALDTHVVYVLGSDGKLWREFDVWDNKESPRVQVDGHVKAFHALDSRIVYVLGSDGKLWRVFDRWNNEVEPRVEVDANVKAFQPLDLRTVFVLGTDGNLWREQETARIRTKVAGNVLAFQAIDDKTVLVLCPGDILFRMQVPETPVAVQTP